MLKHLGTSQSLVLPRFCNGVCKSMTQWQFHTGVVASWSPATHNFEQQKIGGSSETGGKAVLFPSLSTGRAIEGNYRKAATRSLFSLALGRAPASRGRLRKRCGLSGQVGLKEILVAAGTPDQAFTQPGPLQTLKAMNARKGDGSTRCGSPFT